MKLLREQAGLSVPEAAERAGFGHAQQWYKIENGTRTNIELDTLDAIASALGCEAIDLLGSATADAVERRIARRVLSMLLARPNWHAAFRDLVAADAKPRKR